MKQFIEALKKLFKKSKKGFTLIELLVVIGILGILAAALIATIDPFEQLNKATDSTVKNIMVEYINANIRYYATHTAYPWNSSVPGNCQSDITTSVTDETGDKIPQAMQLCSGGSSTTPCSANACLTPLVTDREIKASFVTDTGSLQKIFVSYYGATGGNDANTLIACFTPTSQSGKKDPNTKWAIDGVTAGTDCPSYKTGSGLGVCYWCTK
jgi:type IV pilus assembly protein PilA